MLVQTWQDVTAKLELWATHTNTTGKPIMLIVDGYKETANTGTLVISINGTVYLLHKLKGKYVQT